MWDMLFKHPRGRISLRNLPLLATTLFAAFFLCLFTSNTAYAEDAYRIPNGFSYQGKQFTTQVTIPVGDTRNPSKTQEMIAYEYYTPDNTKAEYILFTDSAAIPNVATALYSTFKYTPPSTYAPATGPTLITLSSNPPPGQPQPQPTQAAVQPSQQNAGSSTCTVPAIGWIVCPVTSQLAAMIDGVYEVLMQFLDVKPMLQGGPIFDVWDAVRNIANICFVIAFLVIIYSQVTSMGLSNYGLKKMIPRLIISAVLVNVSYWICALAVDVSNFLGHSVYQFLMTFATSLNAFNVEITWGSLADGILGGTAAAGIVVGAGLFSVSTAGGLMAALFTLAGMLISVAVAAVTALFILMARQALIVVFTIISPLAFVALVLPKTEKWFDRWRGTFVAMLIMFPIFSLVFGGAVLAGAAIIAGSNNNIFLILLGKGTQLMPLAITPLIVKFSTGVLGTIAQFTNNKNKGLVDRAKNWTNSQAEYHRKRSLANNSTFGRYNPARRFAQFMNDRQVRQQRDMEGYDAATDARARSTNRYRRADLAARQFEQAKTMAGHELEESWNRHIQTNQNAMNMEMRVRLKADDVELAKAQVANLYSELRAGAGEPSNVQRFGTALSDQAYQTAEAIALNSIRKNQAEHTLQNNINKALINDGYEVDADGNRIQGTQRQLTITDQHGTRNISLQEFATGIGKKEIMLATEVAKSRKEYGENVNAMHELAKHYKLTSSQYQDLAATASEEIKIKDNLGNVIYTFSAADEYAKEAAIEHQFKAGSYGQKMDIIMKSGALKDDAGNIIEKGINFDHRATIQDEAVKSGIAKLAPFINDLTYDDILKGNFYGEDSLKMHAMRQVFEGRIKVDTISGANDGALKVLYGLGDRDPNSPNDKKMDTAEFDRIKQMYLSTIEDPQKRAQTAARFDADFNTNYQALRNNAKTILDNTNIARDASENSKKVFEQYKP